MKPNRIIVLGWLAGSLLGSFCQIKAQDTVPCLVFTGNSDSEQCLDLAKLNRITFDNDGMTVTSSKDDCEQELRLLYSLFHHLEIKDANPVPSIPTGLENIEADSNSKLIYDPDTKSLNLESSSDLLYNIGIFSQDGKLLATSKMKAGQTLSLSGLPTGVYIAAAVNGESKLTLKFILK